MHKYVDTSNLVKYQSGKYIGKINWIENIGKKVYFEYEDISGYIEILDYRKDKPQGWITLKYDENILTTVTPNLIHLKVPSLFNKEKTTKKYKYSIGHIIKLNKFDLVKILDQIKIEYNNASTRGYKLKCIDCGFEYESREDKMSSCHICGSRTSQFERIFYNILNQNKIEFIPQMNFQWLSNKFYDCYIPSQNLIIEINGSQHYEPIAFYKNQNKHKELEYAKERDIIKRNAAIEHSITFIEIKALDMKTFYQEIKSKLSNIVILTDEIIFNAEKESYYKFIIKECLLWNSGKTIEEISDELHMNPSKVQANLRIGSKYKICNYDKSVNMHYHKITNTNRVS